MQLNEVAIFHIPKNASLTGLVASETKHKAIRIEVTA